MTRGIKYFVTRKNLFYDNKLLKNKKTITTRLRKYHNSQYCDIQYNPGRFFPMQASLGLLNFSDLSLIHSVNILACLCLNICLDDY